MAFQQIAEGVGLAIDALGVAIIVLGTLVALGRAAIGVARDRASEIYRPLRQDIGRTILLGLEILVAADIIRTVAVEPTIDSVVVLAGIVLIRTFLSFALEVELAGRWPWRRSSAGERGE